MSRSIGGHLPAALRAALAGTDLPAVAGRTFQLLTSAEDGQVSVALLSAGEILAVDERHLRLALWPGTTTTRNLSRSGRGTIVSIEAEGAFYVRFAARRIADVAAAGMIHAVFDCVVEDVLEDEVTYARIVGGVQFDLPDSATVLGRWRETVAAMGAVKG